MVNKDAIKFCVIVSIPAGHRNDPAPAKTAGAISGQPFEITLSTFTSFEFWKALLCICW